MKYTLSVLAVVIVTAVVLLSVFHLLILPYVRPYGFLTMMLIVLAFGMGVATMAERLIERLYYHYHKDSL